LLGSQDEVWIATGCTVGAPGELVHVFTAGAGGVELLGGDDVALAGVSPRRRGTYPLTPSGCGLAAEGRSAWIATNVPPGLARFDYDPVAARSRVVWARARERAPIAIAVGSGFVWTADGGHDVIRQFDANTGRVHGTYRTGADPVAIAAGGDTIWVANVGDDTVTRIDLTANLVSKPIPVGRGPAAIAIGAGAVWVANADDGTVTRIDPGTQRPAATITVGHRPEGIAIADGKVWVTVRD
jgi:YVTN family beta-propeller protein